MKFNKRIIALLGAAAMVLPLAACGGGNDAAGDGGEASGDEKIELTVWSWDSTLPRIVEGFEKENPNIKVTITNAGTNKDEYQALNNAMEAGSGAPDLAQIEYYALPEYVIRGYVQDLSGYGADDFSDFFTPGTWASAAIQGGVYALSMDSGPMAWFYNKDVKDKAGVNPDEVRTWDDFYEAAKKVRATGSYITSDSGDAGFFDSMTWLAGATPFENGGSSLAVIKTDDEAKAEAAYKFAEYACHNADGVGVRVEGGAFPADNETLASEDFLNMTSLTDSEGNAHEYFGGQKFNEVLAKAAANVSTGYKFLPFEVNARNVYADHAGGAFTDKSITLEEGIASWGTALKEYAEQQGYTVE